MEYWIPEDEALSIIGCSPRILKDALPHITNAFTGVTMYKEADINRLRRLMNHELALSIKRGNRLN